MWKYAVLKTWSPWEPKNVCWILHCETHWGYTVIEGLMIALHWEINMCNRLKLPYFPDISYLHVTDNYSMQYTCSAWDFEPPFRPWPWKTAATNWIYASVASVLCSTSLNGSFGSIEKCMSRDHNWCGSLKWFLRTNQSRKETLLLRYYRLKWSTNSYSTPFA